MLKVSPDILNVKFHGGFLSVQCWRGGRWAEIPGTRAGGPAGEYPEAGGRRVTSSHRHGHIVERLHKFR